MMRKLIAMFVQVILIMLAAARMLKYADRENTPKTISMAAVFVAEVIIFCATALG